jgi:DNA transformation protein
VTPGPRSLDAGGDATFLAFVLDQLGGTHGIESRAMFGGHGLYRNGAFFAIVYRGRLFFRTSAATRQEYQARGMQPFRPSARQTLRSYYEVPASVLEDPAEVARWARAAAVATPGPAARRRGAMRAVLLAAGLLCATAAARAQAHPAAAGDSASAVAAAADPALLWKFDTGG